MTGAADRLRVLVTRATGQSDQLIASLEAAGLEAVPVPTIDVELAPGGGALDQAVRRIGSYDWVVVTSTNGALSVLSAAERIFTPFEATRWAAIGSATREVLERAGVDVTFQPSVSTGAGLASELPVVPGDRVLLVRGNLADGRAPAILTHRGAAVEDVLGYTTIEAPASSVGLLAAAFAGPMQIVLFTSGSTVRGLVGLADLESIDVRALPAVCIGRETATEAARLGFDVVAVASAPDAKSLADTAARAVADLRRDLAAITAVREGGSSR